MEKAASKKNYRMSFGRRATNRRWIIWKNDFWLYYQKNGDETNRKLSEQIKWTLAADAPEKIIAINNKVLTHKLNESQVWKLSEWIKNLTCDGTKISGEWTPVWYDG